MLTVAVDLSLPEGSVAVGDSGSVLAVVWWSTPRKHAEVVFSEIDRCLKVAGCSREDIEGVVVTSGPGSFTGVRLSVTVGKAFQCCGVSVFSISTLKGMKSAFESLGVTVVPVIPGRRKRFYTLVEGKLLDIGEEDLFERLRLLKDPLVVYKGEIPESILEGFRCLRDLTPLAASLLLVSEEELEPLKFRYVRDHDAKPPYKGT